jgi:PBSX family phage terminase large subunit
MPDIKLSKRQTECWEYIFDNKTSEICFGGGVSGGKSYLLCLSIATMAIQNAGTRYILGRSVLHTLKQTTLVTLFQVLKDMGLSPDKHFTYNGQDNTVKLFNESIIILKNLEYTPSDPNYERLQGYEVTAVGVDEASQISETCYNILKSRIRYKLTDYNLIPKIILTCNPGNNYIKRIFYIPFQENNLPESKVFIQSLITDNPYVSQDYIDMLQTLPAEQKKRLLYGDWFFTDEIGKLFDYDDIVACSYKNAPNPNDKKYISVDVARFGNDTSIAIVWVGLTVIEIVRYKKLDTIELSNNIKELIAKHGIHPSQVIADSDGLGAGVVDNIRCTPFVNNSSALHKQNFANLKSQAYVKLSDMVKEGKISINVMDSAIVEELTQELLTVKLKDVDKDNKVQVISKDEQKKILGKSPDLSDALMFRMFWEIKDMKTTGRYAIARI